MDQLKHGQIGLGNLADEGQYNKFLKLDETKILFTMLYMSSKLSLYIACLWPVRLNSLIDISSVHPIIWKVFREEAILSIVSFYPKFDWRYKIHIIKSNVSHVCLMFFFFM